jgi:hypothetical protein
MLYSTLFRDRGKAMVSIELKGGTITITHEDLREIREAYDKKLLQLEYPYVLDLITVLAPYQKCTRGFVLDMLWRNRKDAGLPIPPEFEASAQRALEYYCRDSDVFKKRKVAPIEALFCWPKGKGAGVWALIHENAKVWVKKNREALRDRLLDGRV